MMKYHKSGTIPTDNKTLSSSVIPAKAGIQSNQLAAFVNWMPNQVWHDSKRAEAQRTLRVREHSSTGFLLKSPLKTLFSLYIHWPFCLTKCPYCDFFSKVNKGADETRLVEEYLEDLHYYHDLTAEREINTIFFGGGTPSLMKPQNIEKIIEQTAKLWPVSKDVEISLEANPNSNRPQMFSDLRQAGINRLSLGVQALNQADLKFFGRSHTLEEALQALEEVKNTFDNHSLDLIYARPQQKLSDWEKELQQTAGFGLNHISLYQLTIEPGTVFYKQGIQPLEEERAAEMYEFTASFLNNAGYNRYEISNFARTGKECRHNLTYWRGNDYLGIGPGAHGRLKLDGVSYALTHRRQSEKLTATERAEELLIMGLRISEGIDKKRFQNQCGLDFDKFINLKHAEEFVQSGLIINTSGCLRLTDKGFLLLDNIIERLAF